ncbi:hypothetical protein MRX96_004913 [Rhipicephalus microplus]
MPKGAYGWFTSSHGRECRTVPAVETAAERVPSSAATDVRRFLRIEFSRNSQPRREESSSTTGEEGERVRPVPFSSTGFSAGE